MRTAPKCRSGLQEHQCGRKYGDDTRIRVMPLVYCECATIEPSIIKDAYASLMQCHESSVSPLSFSVRSCFYLVILEFARLFVWFC